MRYAAVIEGATDLWKIIHQLSQWLCPLLRRRSVQEYFKNEQHFIHVEEDSGFLESWQIVFFFFGGLVGGHNITITIKFAPHG